MYALFFKRITCCLPAFSIFLEVNALAGLTGLAIIDAICKGEKSPEKLELGVPKKLLS